jgi:hypothetical protein
MWSFRIHRWGERQIHSRRSSRTSVLGAEQALCFSDDESKDIYRCHRNPRHRPSLLPTPHASQVFHRTEAEMQSRSVAMLENGLPLRSAIQEWISTTFQQTALLQYAAVSRGRLMRYATIFCHAETEAVAICPRSGVDVSMGRHLEHMRLGSQPFPPMAIACDRTWEACSGL